MTHGPDDLFARHAWQHQIENHQVILMREGEVLPARAVISHIHRVAFRAQPERDRIGQLLFILNNQYSHATIYLPQM